MAFRTDAHGLAFKCDDIKITSNAHTWAMKLSQIAKQKGALRIITYSLPRPDYIQQVLGKRPVNIQIIAHSKFRQDAMNIMKWFGDIDIRVNDKVHSKVVLAEPETVIVSSANFGSSLWHETSVSLHSKEAHDWYVEHMFTPLWETSELIATRSMK